MNLMNEANRWEPTDGNRPPIGHQLSPEIPAEEHPVAALLLHALHVILKWKWAVAAVTVLALIAGLVISLLTTPMYFASTTIRIDRDITKVTPSTTGGDAAPTATTTADRGAEFYQTQYGVLHSQTVALRAVDDLHLDENYAFLAPKAAHGGATLPPPRDAAEREQRRKWAASNILMGLGVTPKNLSGLVDISYSSPSPQIAALVANGVAKAYMDYNQGRAVDQSAYSRNYVANELATAGVKLAASLRAANDYARQQQIINVQTGGGAGASSGGGGSTGGGQSLTASDLSAVNGLAANARNLRLAAQARWEEVQGLPADQLPEVQGNSALNILKQSRAEAEANLQKLRVSFGEEWPAVVQLKGQVEDLDRQIAQQTQAAKESIHTALLIAQAQEKALGDEVTRQKRTYMEVAEKDINYNILMRTTDTDSATYDSLMKRLQDLTVAAHIDLSNVSVVDPADVPGRPFKPQPLRNMIVAAIVGLGIGALLALGLEQLDETIKSPADIDAKLGIPLLGAIPVAPKDVSPVQAMADPRSALSEAYYSVRTALQFSTRDGAPRTLLVTSARPSEGKSTSAVALAQGFARLGLRTLLIDSDLRNPSLHKQMGVANGVGLSNLLTGQVQLEEAAQPTAFEHLRFVSCGPLPPNPAELLGGPQMRQLLAEAAERFDQVIIDGPPVMGLADAPLLASIAAGTVLVVEAGSTRRGLARAALLRLRVGPVNVVGAILSKFQSNRIGYGYGYGHGANYAYGYEYGGTTSPKPEPKPKKDAKLGGLIKRKKR
ncbi:MAG: exopolysaccharide biosynthesis protein [Caulobacteraceae bacterium]|nr:exopolysaccharide biosynthesis protein [Caulobacteraceae bacterium]